MAITGSLYSTQSRQQCQQSAACRDYVGPCGATRTPHTSATDAVPRLQAGRRRRATKQKSSRRFIAPTLLALRFNSVTEKQAGLSRLLKGRQGHTAVACKTVPKSSAGQRSFHTLQFGLCRRHIASLLPHWMAGLCDLRCDDDHCALKHRWRE